MPSNYGAGLVLVGLGIGVGRGAAGRRLMFTLVAGRALLLPLVIARFTFACGTLALPFVFALVRFAFTGRLALLFTARFVLPFALALALSFVFLFRGRLGLFSFAFVLTLRFAFVVSSSGVTVSDDSPAFVGRLISIATV